MKNDDYSPADTAERTRPAFSGGAILLTGLTALFYAMEEISLFRVRAGRIVSYGYHKALEAGARSGLLRRRSILSLCLACLTAAALSAFCLSFKVSLDGRDLGVVSSQAEFSQAVAMVEEEVSEALGEEYDFGSRITYQLNITGYGDVYGASDYENILLNSVSEVEKLHVVSVNGKIAGGIKTRSELDRELSELLDHYSNENTISASFVEDVDVTYSLADAGIIHSAGELTASLASGVWDLNITVETVDAAEYAEAVSFETEYIYDDSMYSDESTVLREGVNGAALVNYEIICHNGEEIAREETGRLIIEEPVSMQVAVGTQERPSTASTGYFIWPTEGMMTSGFGYRSTNVGSANHTGIDICNNYGTYIYAADGGEVIYSGWIDGYGNIVQIRHDNGYVTYYAHCSSLDVGVGERVYQGQLIARSGSTGTVTANHLHFEVRIDGVAYNGLDFLPAK